MMDASTGIRDLVFDLLLMYTPTELLVVINAITVPNRRRKVCPTGAINHDIKAEILELDVGALILAPGFKAFSPKGIDYYGYDTIKDVITSLEYERMLFASDPWAGHLKKISNNEEPKRIAWI